MVRYGFGFAALALMSGLLPATSANATPALQLFIEAGDTSGNNVTFYEGPSNPDDPDTWVRVGDSNTPFRVWAVAKGESGKKTYEWLDVRFVASFDNGLLPGLDWTPIAGETNYLGSGFNTTTPSLDPDGPSGSIRIGGDWTSDPIDVDPWDTIDGAPNWGHHGQFGPGRNWVEWSLGDMLGLDTLIGNFEPGDDPQVAPFFGSSNFPLQNSELGRISVFELYASGLEPGDIVHFDLWGIANVTECNDVSGECLTYKVNAFSHDARWEQAEEVPAPAPLAMLGLGLIGLASLRKSFAN